MPLILLAGDCTGSAYIFTPRTSRTTTTTRNPSTGSSVSSTFDSYEEENLPPDVEIPTKTIVSDTDDTFSSTNSNNLLNTNKQLSSDPNSIQNTRISSENVDGSSGVGTTTTATVGVGITTTGTTGVGTLSPIYDLAFEIECGATVGSAAAAPATDGTNSVDIYVPSYELNQVSIL